MQFIWENLREIFNKIERAWNFELHRYIYHVTQGTLSIATYLNKFKIMWDEFTYLDDLVLIYDVNNALLIESNDKQKDYSVLTQFK